MSYTLECRYMGLPVYVEEPSPKMRVSSKFRELQHPDLVAETDAWMAEFFGSAYLLETEIVYKLVDPITRDTQLRMNRETFNKVKEQLK